MDSQARSLTDSDNNENTKNTCGRPRKELDFKLIDGMMAIQCSIEEIAAALDCATNTIRNRIFEAHNMTYEQYFKIKRQPGLTSLRRKLFKMALEDDSEQIAKFLAKNLLGYSDQVEIKQDQLPKATIIEKLDGTQTVLGAEMRDVEPAEPIEDTNAKDES